MGTEVKGLIPGLRFIRRFKTLPEHSAKHVGSGDVEVLSTPSMIAFMEEASRLVVEDKLPHGFTTVGTLVNVRHLAAAPIGDEVEIRGILLSVDGRRLTFWVEAWWRDKKIGQGVHERTIVNREEFLNRLRESLKLK